MFDPTEKMQIGTIYKVTNSTTNVDFDGYFKDGVYYQGNKKVGEITEGGVLTLHVKSLAASFRSSSEKVGKIIDTQLILTDGTVCPIRAQSSDG